MGGGPWAGGPNANTLDLLDGSVGALVHTTEDELSQVRVCVRCVCACLCVCMCVCVFVCVCTHLLVSAPNSMRDGGFI